MSTTPIVHFGTSRFLQAHVDLFVSDAAERGDTRARPMLQAALAGEKP